MDLFTFDDDYVRRLRAHDPATVDHFYAYFNAHFRITFGGKLSREALDDVRHTTYLRVFQKLDEVRDAQRFGAWVHKIGIHVRNEYYRNERRNERTDYIELPRNPDVIEDLINQENRKRIRLVLKRLKPPRDGEILKALFLDEEPKDQICARFGINRDYLRVLVHRALENFKNVFYRGTILPFVVTLGGLWSLSR